MNSADVVIVGASVSGCRTAELIAKEGYKVLVLEEHKKIGLPLKCTGLVSWRLKELIPDLPSNIFVNSLKEAKFFSPGGESFTLQSEKPVYVIDRKRLDEHLAERASKAGSDFILGVKFLWFDHRSQVVKTTGDSIKTKMLIAADGANSSVARFLKLKQPDKKLIGLQATVKGDFENCAELWFGSSLAPNFFAWVVPEDGQTARVGLATDMQPMYYFKKFLERRVGIYVKPDTAGLIRIGLIKESVADRVMLVGDAACMVKPFSGGGIIYSLIGSRICAKACIDALEKNNFSRDFLKKVYEREWKKVLSKPIKKGMFYRNILSVLSDRCLDLLFSSIKIFGIKFLENFDMDFLS